MVGGEEMMGDRLLIETKDGKAVPHELTVSSLEVVWSTVGPYVNTIEPLRNI
jgi:short subunit dehydrogenase-like uncharacterized protein